MVTEADIFKALGDDDMDFFQGIALEEIPHVLNILKTIIPWWCQFFGRFL